MPRATQHTLASLALSLALLLPPTGHAATDEAQPGQSRAVDLVLAIDVSGSMSGLIDSARQRLWEVVNTFGQASPEPDLRVAVISYGNPTYGEAGGFVRLDQPLTRDLDVVNQTLFTFATKGGEEYVARVIQRAAEELEWSPDPDALRVLFVAGNESAAQDPTLDLRRVAMTAKREGIVVNTIFCGADGTGSVPASWRAVAQHAGGVYVSIDQDASAVAGIAAPQDDELQALNDELNATYVPYGRLGQARQKNQKRQDLNAARMSAPAAASRTVTKATTLYRAGSWDLVDALDGGLELEQVDTGDLPEEMQNMTASERQTNLEKKADERKALQARIQRLARERGEYLRKEQARLAGSEPTGFSQAVTQGLRAIAERKGFSFSE